MTDFAAAISAIQQAASSSSLQDGLQQIAAIASGFSASGTAAGGVVYSGNINGTSLGNTAVQIANNEELSVINKTARGAFLSNPQGLR